MQAGEWWHSTDHDEPCRVVDVDTLWGQATCLVWLPRRGTAVRVLQKRLVPLKAGEHHLLQRLSYVSAAARIADALERDELVAPLEGTVIPLPHQLLALQRAISGDRIRYLLADEVGLGKTIEAGLILRELKIRGLVRRILVVAPAGLVLQWQSEMKTHFGEDFRLILPGTFAALRQAGAVGEDENLWRMQHQVICTVDSVKPMDTRRGWSQDQIARYNRERFEDLVSAGWDLIIVDEAHRLGGSTEQVARFKLGDALSQAAPYLLLLSATPHQGKSDAFRRLIGFLDPDALPGDDAITREAVAPFVIRTEKRRAIDANENPLFKPRFTQLVPIEWGSAHTEQRALYDAVTEYVRDGYNRAIKEKQTAVGFLMILMQRLITSSTAAIRTALERRLTVLELPQGQLSLFPEDVGEDWSSLDGQQQFDTILRTRLKGLKDERKEVELLLSAARRCEAEGPDVKAEALLDRIQLQQREENDPTLKVLIFTEFIPTQAMLANFLEHRGFTVVSLNGSMDLEERRQAQRRFAGDAQILLSTDAGGEGLNLQFCHVIVNYDLPWNPMKIEQRIGRVDRIGQKHIVRAMNFALEGTVELRVREVLEQKLARILEEFGVDKLADVLDSEEGGVPFEELFAQAIVAPEDAERRASALADDIRRRAEEARAGSRLLSATERLDASAAKKIATHQMPYWTERLTLGFLRSQESAGATVKTAAVGYDLRWPNGDTCTAAVFSRDDADRAGVTLISLEDERVRGLTTNLPVFAPGQPIPSIVIPDVSDKTSGVWSLWRISLHSAGGREQRFVALFLTEDGRVFGPTARAVWERLIDLPSGLSQAGDELSGKLAVDAFDTSRKAAEEHGTAIFEELATAHQLSIVRERKKGVHAYASRRRAIERLGLPQVRAHRLRLVADEEQAWSGELAAREAALPDLAAILMVRVASTGKIA
ncbi:MAG: DEAD/DEAH box helicase family protein [Hyphomicrobium sp.]|uniref:DEAD/DEAH box helicase n=1 Tax=Hyphomicrobium sp. TaxID=82 RepID=UPI0025BF7B36|nr:helicase-related protein [Hyphomicrobium sp.]MBX9864942.1 DEAD/DEAH box helicase family protein [Hyphomicrobium sp.]